MSGHSVENLVPSAILPSPTIENYTKERMVLFDAKGAPSVEQTPHSSESHSPLPGHLHNHYLEHIESQDKERRARLESRIPKKRSTANNPEVTQMWEQAIKTRQPLQPEVYSAKVKEITEQYSKEIIEAMKKPEPPIIEKTKTTQEISEEIQTEQNKVPDWKPISTGSSVNPIDSALARVDAGMRDRRQYSEEDLHPSHEPSSEPQEVEEFGSDEKVWTSPAVAGDSRDQRDSALKRTELGLPTYGKIREKMELGLPPQGGYSDAELSVTTDTVRLPQEFRAFIGNVNLTRAQEREVMSIWDTREGKDMQEVKKEIFGKLNQFIIGQLEEADQGFRESQAASNTAKTQTPPTEAGTGNPDFVPKREETKHSILPSFLRPNRGEVGEKDSDFELLTEEERKARVDAERKRREAEKQNNKKQEPPTGTGNSDFVATPKQEKPSRWASFISRNQQEVGGKNDANFEILTEEQRKAREEAEKIKRQEEQKEIEQKKADAKKNNSLNSFFSKLSQRFKPDANVGDEAAFEAEPVAAEEEAATDIVEEKVEDENFEVVDNATPFPARLGFIEQAKKLGINLKKLVFNPFKGRSKEKESDVGEAEPPINSEGPGGIDEAEKLDRPFRSHFEDDAGIDDNENSGDTTQ